MRCVFLSACATEIDSCESRGGVQVRHEKLNRGDALFRAGGVDRQIGGFYSWAVCIRMVAVLTVLPRTAILHRRAQRRLGVAGPPKTAVNHRAICAQLGELW